MTPMPGDVDSFGVPANTFGWTVDERFYGAVGRVVISAALVEHAFADVVAFVAVVSPLRPDQLTHIEWVPREPITAESDS